MTAIPATYNRFLIDAGELRLNYVDAENPGVRLGATRGGNVFSIEPIYHTAEVDGTPGPVKGERRLVSIDIKLRVNLVELSPLVLSMGLPGSSTVHFIPPRILEDYFSGHILEEISSAEVCRL